MGLAHISSFAGKPSQKLEEFTLLHQILNHLFWSHVCLATTLVFRPMHSSKIDFHKKERTLWFLEFDRCIRDFIYQCRKLKLCLPLFLQLFPQQYLSYQLLFRSLATLMVLYQSRRTSLVLVLHICLGSVHTLLQFNIHHLCKW